MVKVGSHESLIKMRILVNSLYNSKVLIYECENLRLQIDPLGKVVQEGSLDREVEVANKTEISMAKK